MSDKLEKCVCGHIVTEYTHHSRRGNDGIIEHDYSIRCLNPKANWCPCETPRYSTIDEAATAWNTMQRALKSGWTSEVPTESGDYLFLGEVNISYQEIRNVMRCERVVHIIVDVENNDADIGSIVTPLKDCKGLWFSINYPYPPKD